MPLLPLFDTGETVLADDALGRIVYTPVSSLPRLREPGSPSSARA